MLWTERLSHRLVCFTGVMVFAVFGLVQPGFGQESDTVSVDQAAPPDATPEQVVPEPREPAEILAEMETIEYPKVDEARTDDIEYMKEYRTQLGEANLRKAVLIHELYKSDPTHEKLLELMPERWELLYHGPGIGALQLEIQEVIDTMPGSPLVKPAMHWIDFIELKKVFEGQNVKPGDFLKAAEEYATKYPDDERVAPYLFKSARWAYQPGSDQWLAMHRRIALNYPESQAGKRSAGKVRQIDSIGQPFEMIFPNAITEEHEPIDIKQMRGKVVIVHFWATWLRNIDKIEAEMKVMYEKYHDRGLEILGVSLDMSPKKGGLTRLLRFTQNHELPWPQYYQGRGWEGEFSSYWGIDGVPWSFVIDASGRLHTTNPGNDLENTVRELLGMEPLPPVTVEPAKGDGEKG